VLPGNEEGIGLYNEKGSIFFLQQKAVEVFQLLFYFTGATSIVAFKISVHSITKTNFNDVQAAVFNFVPCAVPAFLLQTRAKKSKG
jgi:hypothetical protein